LFVGPLGSKRVPKGGTVLIIIEFELEVSFYIEYNSNYSYNLPN
jgi:hypothetical protein